MYVIGTNSYNFIKIDVDVLYDGQKIFNQVRAIEYEATLLQATMISSYNEAERIIKEIQDNIEQIYVANISIIGEILAKDKSFDKVAFSKTLKVYELVPTEVC